MIAFAFFLKLNLDRIIVQRSLKKLAVVDFLTGNQMECYKCKISEATKRLCNLRQQKKLQECCCSNVLY